MTALWIISSLKLKWTFDYYFLLILEKKKIWALYFEEAELNKKHQVPGVQRSASALFCLTAALEEEREIIEESRGLYCFSLQLKQGGK